MKSNIKVKNLLIIFTLKIFLINFFGINKLYAFIPYYHLPSDESLEKDASLIAKKAYQFLTFGKNEEGLQLARLAFSIDQDNENILATLVEAQIRNNLIEDALKSIRKGKKLSPGNPDFYFVESSIYLNKKNLRKSRRLLLKGLDIEPKNTLALFQLGNIFLMERNYKKSLSIYDKAIRIKPDFWQVINNKGLIYYEMNEKVLAEKNFIKALSINRNGETLLALAVSLQSKDPQKAIQLAKEALKIYPQFVSYEFRKEQLWGNELQSATKILFKSKDLQLDINLAEQF